jgi:hypothetical protein
MVNILIIGKFKKFYKLIKINEKSEEILLGYNFGINKLFEKSTQKFLGGILKKENKKNTVDFINKKFGVLDYLNNNYIKIILNKDDLKFIKFETNEKNIDVEILVKLLISCDLKATKNS